jgi:hypothetical protein
MRYEKFNFFFPPRPKNACPIPEITNWESKDMIAQPKINGSNVSIHTNGKEYHVMSRHGSILSNFTISQEELSSIYSGTGWMVINGEYCNKNKKGDDNNPFNHKIIIFDILVYNSEHLTGKTFQERVDLLDTIYGKKDSEIDYLYSNSENIYRVKSYYDGFNDLFNILTKIDIIEGLVLKRKSAPLQMGLNVDNNSRSQVKFRKPTANYRY